MRYDVKISDQREPSEMNAAACPNPKCSESLNLQTDETTKCPKCDEAISEKYRQMFRDVMSVSRMHLDKMKMSNVACK